MSMEHQFPFNEDPHLEISFELEDSIEHATELKELLVAYENMDEEEAADLIADEIRVLRQKIERNLASLSLAEVRHKSSLSTEQYNAFFSSKGEIFILIAEAALDTQDIEDAYQLYTEAIEHTVSGEQQVLARLGCIFARAILRIDDPTFDAKETPKDAEDLGAIISLIEGNDQLTSTFIHNIYHLCYREYQSNMMYQEDEDLEDFPEAMRRTLRQAIFDDQLPDWMYDFFEGLLSYMEDQEELTERHFRKSAAILKKSQNPRSVKLLKKFLDPEW